MKFINQLYWDILRQLKLKQKILFQKMKTMRPKRYKPAFTMGFRGFPKTYKPCGSVPAPTMDQVRKLERASMPKLHVKAGGLLYFKEDGRVFTREEAAKRRNGKMIEMAESCQA